MPRRRRRTPEAAQDEILAAAQALLRERPFREVTVDEVMRRTGLSRPSFYVYFRDRYDLVLRVVEHLSADLLVEANSWFGGEGGAARARDAIEGVVEVYERHGPVLRALADAAADDRDVEAAYGSMVQRFIDATEKHLRSEMAAGRVELRSDPREIAKALIWMNERYLYLSLGGDARTPRTKVAETLQCVWVRTIYGES